METQKILNLLGDNNESSEVAKRKWYVINA